MTIRLSPALQNFIAAQGSWKNFFDNGSIEIYTGSQPATPDLAVTGTNLVIITSGGGTKTSEVKGLGILTISGTTSGTIDTCTLMGIDILGGAVTHTGDHNTTATAVALKINRNPANNLVVASSTGSSGVVTLTALPGFGTTMNAGTLTFTATTCTAAVTSTTFGSGTGGGTAGVAAANGLRMDYNAAAGVFTKDTTQTWSGTAIGAGTQTAGWFRYIGSIADAGTQDSSAVYLRMDGSIATSGADMNMSSTSVTNGAIQTISTFSFTIPAA
ncbi:MAG: hypothetical protein NUW01_01355 [Gemmatimonadaceae bacterium]|nr:hypothetical protein [Gemmatimonadaceae bacterium]